MRKKTADICADAAVARYADEYGFNAGKDAFLSENYATAVAI